MTTQEEENKTDNLENIEKTTTILDNESIKSLLKTIHEKNGISLKTDDPLLILITCFEFLLTRSEEKLNTYIEENIQIIEETAARASKNVELTFNDELKENIELLLNEIQKKKEKEFTEYNSTLNDANNKMNILKNSLETQISWIRSMVWFNLVTAIIICFSTLIFCIRIL